MGTCDDLATKAILVKFTTKVPCDYIMYTV